MDVARSLLRRGPAADYARQGRSAWLDVPWGTYRHEAAPLGRRVAYVDLPAPGAPVLLVHGLGASWPVWLEQLPVLQAAGHRVLAPDLPGFGGSAMPAGPISVDGYADTVAALLDGVGVRRAHVVGHSLGGCVAAALARRRPDLVDRLVLAAPALLWRDYRRSGPLVALARAAERVLTAAARRGGGGPAALGGAAAMPVPHRPRLRAAALGASGVHVPQRVPPEFQVELLRIARRTPGYVGALRALRGPDLPGDLAAIRAPVLLAWGDRDTLVGAEQLPALRERLPAAQALLLPDTGHRLMIEQPVAFNAAVLRFLSG